MLLSSVAQSSQGLSGREIRTCMRLALPKAVRVPTTPALALAHLKDAIDQVANAMAHIQSNNNKHNTPTLEVARKLLGVS
ncbi:hypothetical protein D3C80_2000380 [compost metagenome]